MNLKLLVGGVVVVAACLVVAALSADRLSSSTVPTDRPDLDAVVAADQEPAAAARDASRPRALEAEIRSLEAEVARKDDQISELRRVLDESALDDGTDGEPTPEESRERRWERIEELLSGMQRLLAKMDEEGANQFRLASHMAAKLGKVTPEQFAEIVAFDAEETVNERLETIRAFMTQALIHAPDAAHVRNEYMARVLDRVHAGTYGDVFTEEALHRLSFAVPPHQDTYASLIEPLDEELRGRFIDLAAHRLHAARTEPLQLDGARFLSRSTDPRATDELISAFRQTTTEAWVRLAVLDGLASRAATDDRVLRFLRDSEPVEPQRAVRTKLNDILDRLAAADPTR